MCDGLASPKDFWLTSGDIFRRYLRPNSNAENSLRFAADSYLNIHVMKIMTLLSAFCLLSLPVVAAEATTESVEKLFVVTNVQASLDAVRGGSEQRMKIMITEAMKAYPEHPELQKVAIEIAERMGKEFSEALKWENLKNGYVKLYQESFTQEEVDAQIAFYESPVGKSVVEKMPAVSSKSSFIIQQRYLPLMQEMQKLIKEELTKALSKE